LTDSCEVEVTSRELYSSEGFLWNLLLRLQKIVMTVSSMLIVLIIVFSVIARYFFHANLYGYEEIVTIFAFWLYFMGGAYGSYNGTHISADLMNVYLPEGNLKQFVYVIRDIVTIGMAFLFTYYAYDFFMFGFMGPLGTGVALPRSPVWRLPMAISYASVFLGYILMSFYFTVHFVHDLRVFLRGRK